MKKMSRRVVLLGGLLLPGCAAITTLNQAATPRDTYELQPVKAVAQETGGNRTLLVLEPVSSAAIGTDRILIRRNPLAVTYLPDARWADDAPMMLQSVLVRSLAATGGFGFVGPQGAGPIPDVVLLTRIDAFGVDVADGNVRVGVFIELTVLRDRDQRVLGARAFSGDQEVASDQADQIVRGFQQALDGLLPVMADWVVARSG